MPGGGTKLATIRNNPPPARLLDLTRLISRAGRTPTGVDRVELAYLTELLTQDVPLFALVRTSLGYVLLDPDGAAAIAARFSGAQAWGLPDRLSRLTRSKSQTVRQAESDLRRYALARCRPRGISKLLGRHLPRGTAYVNVGHSNLSDRTLQAVRHGIGGQIAVMIHDVIPLEFPQYQRPGTPERFRLLLKRVRAQADLVIYNTADTRARAQAQMEQWGPLPEGIVAHLGVAVPQPRPQEIPAGLDLSRPYFVALGTVEPRKGHDLLLDVWQDLPDPPGLMICGARGWNNEAVFQRLDALPRNGPIRELSGLSDGAIAALLLGSRGLLFPSRAEGFGLPPAEAAALGVPVVCSDIPALREILQDNAVYLEETDRYQWRNKLLSLLRIEIDDRNSGRRTSFVPPDWAQHFNFVLRYT